MAPRQKAAESRKIPESGLVIPREGVERMRAAADIDESITYDVIPREGVERAARTPRASGAPKRVIPREGVESGYGGRQRCRDLRVIPREGVESFFLFLGCRVPVRCDPERGS